MIRKAKGFELMNFFFITNWSKFGSKMLLIMKTINFENVPLTTNCSCLCDRRHECIIYMIYNQFVIKMCLNLKCSVKGGT